MKNKNMAQQQQQKHQQSYISSRERSALTENGVLRVENEELRRRLQGVERENQNLQERLENGRRALAALVFKGSELEGVKVEMEVRTPPYIFYIFFWWWWLVVGWWC